MSVLLQVLDLTVTFVFGLSGAVAGVRHKTDLFGVLVLSFVAGNTGGILRDVFVGVVPPTAISNWENIVVSLLPGVITFYFYPVVKRVNNPVLAFDAAGLSLFAVSGALKALDFHLNPLAAVLLGVLTAVGGGMARDMLVGEIPAVLRTDVYAVAALVGASVTVAGAVSGFSTVADATIGGALCFVIRILAIRGHWNLPTAPRSE